MADGVRLLPGCEPGQAIAGYWVDVSCLSCGGQVVHEAAGTPGAQTRAIARCVDCRTPWQVKVELLSERGNIHGPSPFAKGHGASYDRRPVDRRAGAA